MTTDRLAPKPRGGLLRKTYVWAVLLFLYAPILTLIVFSFNAVKSRSTWGGFTLQWYAQLFHDPEILRAVYITFLCAILAAVIATVLGTLGAIGVHAMKKGMRLFSLNLSRLPMLTPDIVTGISLMILFIFMKLPLGFGTLLLAHVAFNTPYVVFSVLPKLAQMDIHLYEAALDLGATPTQALLRVIVPQIMPGIVTGALLSFTLSLDDFVISFFTGGDMQNLSVLIYSMARRGINPTINALSTIMFLLVLVLLLVVNRRASLVDHS